MTSTEVGSGNQPSPEHSVPTVQERSDKDNTLKSAPLSGDGIAQAAQFVHDTFARSEAQGYRSKDRQFAIEVLGQALRQAADGITPAQEKK